MTNASSKLDVDAALFDVFGTVVDWRASIARAAAEQLGAKGFDRDWFAFADAWRALYQPAMEEVRSGREGFVTLDALHRRNLERVFVDFEIDGLGADEADHLNRAWHRLDPWPDAVAGLVRLKSRFTIGTLSNGNIALIVNMAKHAGLPWDVVLGAEVARAYKPQPEAYLRSAAALDIAPARCLMVAAHVDDLVAAAATGFRTAYVPRPDERGLGVADPPRADFDLVAKDFLDLANQLGCS